MSRPIESTPILTGKDARIFCEGIEASKKIKIDHKERDRIMRNHYAIIAITK